ncbi:MULTISPECIES: sigma-70 family RNA polymerase sigma factor [Geobacillus]|uniref:sigma-70 family RNA polymerase sigma factor n=1 Tax=Geobacillus TaxID=129337 RepID=UPI0009BC8BB1|nr:MULTISPECIES: sigma-70 family RNA polymerase sigma factor [Geobacillus]MED4878470.1 sigma-70 family RNA polymerase sigma factor [Anoxybacillus geothermalis]MED3731709.1 sigma-70 family RNA polymerase sigma factor [Geobacillus stearothermophilus]MED3735067.1 sigma-70 family RNA polymerase sigma factor [Geobacillus stearothermophilus]MED3741868.1 sigma-70 family RNA polymerase sigma factor [Geobacillus stearothermophilus]MED3765944.1 sigma-70 family RNA polymerase sigma factor [Geobacillus st
MEDRWEDMELLEKIAEGSRTAFDRFYEKYAPVVYHIALRIVGNEAEAEDVSHDVFLEILQKPHQFDPKRGSVQAFLAVKTKSRSLDRLRKKRDLLVSRLEEAALKEKGAEFYFLRQLEQQVILDALTHLPEEQRQAIIHFYFRGETQREIAAAMNKPLGSVKSLIRYGLRNLRKQKELFHWMEAGRGEEQHEA